MIGVVIPAHNEEHHIAACQTSVLSAAAHPGLPGQQLCVVVVDDCSDQTAQIVSAHDVSGIEVSFWNMGKARSTGAAGRWREMTWLQRRRHFRAHDWLARQVEF